MKTKKQPTPIPWQPLYQAQGIQEYQLSNGLKVLLVENHSAPVVTVLVVYKVGSRNEAVGYTGSTHFLEHMLFKGTPNFNKQRGTQIAQVLMQEGANYNATTWLDRTTYYETLPAERLELALQIESERMRHAFIRDKDRQAEMTVVRNELERHENEPDSIMWSQLFAHAFLAHPYHHPTIGWHSDVEGVPTARLKKFYDQFYHPNNATLVLVGALQPQATMNLVQQYFGAIPASRHPIPQMYSQEFVQQGQRRFEVKRPGQLGIIKIAFHVPALEHPDSYGLDVIQDLLSDGVSSRLYQALVETRLALYASAYNLQLRDPGLFIITAKVASGISPATVEAAIMQVLNQLKEEPVPERELDKIKNQAKAAFAYHRHGTYQLATTLAEFEAMATWRYLLDYLPRLEQINATDVQALSRRYFKTDNQTVGYFIPEAADTVTIDTAALPQPEIHHKVSTVQKKTSAKVPIQRLTFGHNSVLLAQENHLDNTVAIRGHIKAGSLFEPHHKPGLASLTAAMLNKGTLHYRKLELVEALAHMGSSLDFRPGLEGIHFAGRCLSEHLPATLHVLQDMLRHPVFPADEFHKLKQQRCDAIKQRLDSTDEMAYQLLYQALYPPTHPYYQPSVADLLQATEQLTLKDIKAFYKQHYGCNRMIVSAVGDIHTSQVHDLFAGAYGSWNPNTPAAPAIPLLALPTSQRLVYPMPDKANVSILMGHPTHLHRQSPDFFAAMLANHALGQSSLSSRLGLRIRDQLGLTYGIHSYFSDVGFGPGTWTVSVTTNPVNIEKAVTETQRVLAKYLAEGITSAELISCKSAMTGSYLVGLATNPEIAYRLLQLEQYQLGLNYFQERAKQIDKVTQKMVNQALKHHIHPENLIIAMAGQEHA